MNTLSELEKEARRLLKASCADEYIESTLLRKTKVFGIREIQAVLRRVKNENS